LFQLEEPPFLDEIYNTVSYDQSLLVTKKRLTGQWQGKKRQRIDVKTRYGNPSIQLQVDPFLARLA
jgi:hypothetical protein